MFGIVYMSYSVNLLDLDDWMYCLRVVSPGIVDFGWLGFVYIVPFGKFVEVGRF